MLYDYEPIAVWPLWIEYAPYCSVRRLFLPVPMGLFSVLDSWPWYCTQSYCTSSMVVSYVTSLQWMKKNAEPYSTCALVVD